MPRVIVLVPNAEGEAALVADAVARGAAHVRFTEVEPRVVSAAPVIGRSVRTLRGSDDLRDSDAVVFVAGHASEATDTLLEALDAAEHEQPADAFLDTVFAVAGTTDAQLLSRVARLGGIIVSPPRAAGDAMREAEALGERVATVVEWVRHARSHEHGRAHGASHHHD